MVLLKDNAIMSKSTQKMRVYRDAGVYMMQVYITKIRIQKKRKGALLAF